MPGPGYIVWLKNVDKTYSEGKTSLKVLSGVNLKVKKGEFIGIVGPSGSGKSTLLNIIGLLDTPTKGELKIESDLVTGKTKINRLAHLRRKKIGFVFQTFNLLPRLSAQKNVELPMVYARVRRRRERAVKLLILVGLAKRLKFKPPQLSGGERQRVAIARALANNPEIILADEPTGNLDSKSGRQIIQIIKKLNREGKTIIVVTHDQDIARQADRIIKLKDGKIR